MPDTAVPLEIIVDHVEHEGLTTRVTRVSTTSSSEAHAFVLVAGVGVAATYFELLAPTLARRGDVYALDLPGFGGMPRPGAQPTAAFFADHVEAVLDHHALVNPVLIGHSMGAQIVTEVLVRRASLTHAVLVGPVVNEAESSAGILALRFVQSSVRESLHLAMTALSAYVLCGVVYFLTVLPHMMRYRITDRIRGVRARTLLIRGEFDSTSPRRFHSRLVAASPDPWRWEIEGAAHSVIHGHAIGVARLTLRHLDGELARRGRMPAHEAEVPPPPRADFTTLLRAFRARAVEWVSALRGHEDGVARAKAHHARLLWRAYSSGTRSSRGSGSQNG